MAILSIFYLEAPHGASSISQSFARIDLENSGKVAGRLHQYTTFIYIFSLYLLMLFFHFLLVIYNDNYVYKLFAIFSYVIDIIFIEIL